MFFLSNELEQIGTEHANFINIIKSTHLRNTELQITTNRLFIAHINRYIS